MELSLIHICQIDTVSDQVLGLAVLSSEFENYSEKSTYDRLLLYRKITSQLTNICISNDTIDNIYILDFDGNGFSSNSCLLYTSRCV